jgi:putative transposase
MRLKELAVARPRFGYLRLHTLLRREGWKVNRKRVYRLYREEGLEVRTKKRKKKIATQVGAPQSEATCREERWSMGFFSDQLVGGRRIRVLTLVDLYSRECLALQAGFSLKGGDVAAVLEQLKHNGRKPKNHHRRQRKRIYVQGTRYTELPKRCEARLHKTR